MSKQARSSKLNYHRKRLCSGLSGDASLTGPKSDKVCFVKADTRSWDDQVRIFEAAVTKSLFQSVDLVIANAGVGRGSGDPMMALDGTPRNRWRRRYTNPCPPDPYDKPTKPSMHIIDINLIGVMYSLKLAIHYFRRSPADADRDRCFIFGGSIAGYLDNLVSHG